VGWVTSATASVVPFAVPAEKGQAEYYRALLRQRCSDLGEQIARDHTALSPFLDGGDRRHARRALRRIAEKRREQLELEQLRARLERRFFGGTPAPIAARRCFDVSVERHGSWWAVAVPELDENVPTRHREDIETAARAHIAAVIDAPMSDIAVRFVGEANPHSAVTWSDVT
jgi:hypothetical protein